LNLFLSLLTTEKRKRRDYTRAVVPDYDTVISPVPESFWSCWPVLLRTDDHSRAKR
jgi:hypothetical protein